ncbi:MAG: riboflavin synthase [bacterium]
MFTGLVEVIGTIRQVERRGGNRLFSIQADFARELKAGESVAVNGCCLTVVTSENGWFKVEATAATLKGTNLSRLVAGERVNLERALVMGERLGGHLVLGHIDEVGFVKHIERRSGERLLTIRVKPENCRMLVPKGSVAIDGVSLTVRNVKRGEFCVNLIPFTLMRTTLSERHGGDWVNIEYDMLVKGAQRAEAEHPRL